MEIVRRWRSRGIEVSDSEEKSRGKIHLLIGADYVNQFLKEQIVVEGEVAWKSSFGWVLSGPVKTTDCQKINDDQSNAYSTGNTVNVAYVTRQVEALWELDDIPNSNQTILPAFPISYDKNARLYEVGLLWKGSQRPTDNKDQAEASAKALRRRLEKNGAIDDYENVLMKEYQDLNAIEKEDQPHKEGYYMPHHAVIREAASTTKIRVVFNASSAKKGKMSLNGVLDAGPSLLPDLPGLLLRFREYQCAVQADIRKAFFMIAIRPEDRQFLRFVWINQDNDLQVWRLKKLPFGVNCSPFILSAVLQHHLRSRMSDSQDQEFQDMIRLLLRSFYVDDCISSLSSEKQAEFFQKNSSEVLNEAGMELRKWRGNTIESSKDAGNKVLGVVWKLPLDVLQVEEVKIETPDDWSRRTLLQWVAAVFDPLGFVSPLTITGKILLQAVWKEKGGWDTPLSATLADQVQKWTENLSELPNFQVQRWIGAQPDKTYVLHVFCDASELAYGCCIYIVMENEQHLLFSKGKVAPLKKLAWQD